METPRHCRPPKRSRTSTGEGGHKGPPLLIADWGGRPHRAAPTDRSLDQGLLSGRRLGADRHAGPPRHAPRSDRSPASRNARALAAGPDPRRARAVSGGGLEPQGRDLRRLLGSLQAHLGAANRSRLGQELASAGGEPVDAYGILADAYVQSAAAWSWSPEP